MSAITFVADRRGRMVEVPFPDATPLDGDGVDRAPLGSGTAAPAEDAAVERRCFRVSFDDGHEVLVEGADTYQPEGHLITFFQCHSARGTIDSWSVRVASYRAAEVSSIDRVPAAETRRAPALVAVG